MLTVYNCIVNEHDLRLVALAALICAIASFAAVNLLQHVTRSTGTMGTLWLAVSAISTGFGIWATHFIAMLAFSPDMPTGYNSELTALSLAAAVILTGLGMWVATLHDDIEYYMIGGALIGGGIAAMHFTGMAAFEVQGRLEWNTLMAAFSVLSGVVLASGAIYVALRRRSVPATLSSAGLLTLAICAHHFIAMGSVAITPDSSIEIPTASVEPTALAFAVAAVSLAILVLSGAAVWVDLRLRQTRLEADRMHGLANAAVEGLIVCDGHRIVSINDSVVKLTGMDGQTIEAMALPRLFQATDAFDAMSDWGDRMQEAELKTANGSGIPVELIAREIDYCGKPHTVVAVRDIRERKKAEADILHLAHFDPLTGLPNRRSFSAKLDMEIASPVHCNRKQMALLLIDLDRFKEVNDLFGHGAGDAMLQTVAHSISGLLRQGQMVARLGGDEFAVILPNLTDSAAAGRVAESILRALREENRASAGEISASIGVALYPRDAQDSATLMGHADTALYRAKADGKDTCRFFETAMGAEARDRRLMEVELRHAVARNEFRLVYQPQKEISGGKVLGFEALIRWEQPQRGNVSPATFIPIAEESGAIIQIGEWVLATACAEAASWPNPLTIAVNVSAVQLHNPNFTSIVHETLLQSGLAPDRLELEITEAALVKDMQRALATLRQVKALGVRVAMDDFGTGYSSLSNLRAFPFDKIKIDGSFIKSVDRNGQIAAIVRAVLGLGRGLGLPVLAEGVETLNELKFLDAEACQIGQGYFLGRPGPIGGFAKITGKQAVKGKPLAPLEEDDRLQPDLLTA
jgi:diguanylate cyclase (GGDEF)-like protein/PAS domain S-box-containing protein